MKDVTRPVLWRRLDCPGHESAAIFHEDNAWHLQGTAVFLYNNVACRLNYQIICDSRWHTRSARVDGWVGNSTIESAIVVAPDRRWRLNERDCPQVEGCVDLDLNFSPSTNLLPIRRLELSPGEEKEVRAAWLRFPSFELEPLTQLYRRMDENTYRYESSGGEFVRELTVNEDGFVTNYPDFWQAEVKG
ncbi:MAG TPA: putative glycolipid-binding domain-containing protein [Pyrinomonadaceae bacterium]|nr:putative glycolipid-binding domain-containing protein [Pyrinomonadaceae bacterium]